MNEGLTKEIIYSASARKGTSMEVVDADWKDQYGIAVILQKNKKTTIQLKGVEIDVSFTQYNISLIRWIDGLHILVATYENKKNEENVFIIDLTGRLVHSFNGGEYIEEIAVGKEGIWTSYFDQGVMGSGISTQGLVLFDSTGNVLFRYHSDLLDRPDIFDCYAICKGAGTVVWLFPYIGFPLVEINPKNRTSHAYRVPEMLHGSHALCVRGKYAYFFDPYDADQLLYQLEIGTQEPLLLGTIQGTVRGLNPSETHHFISISDQQVTLHQVLNEDEYKYS